jgi:hypothetical protein
VFLSSARRFDLRDRDTRQITIQSGFHVDRCVTTSSTSSTPTIPAASSVEKAMNLSSDEDEGGKRDPVKVLAGTLGNSKTSS